MKFTVINMTLLRILEATVFFRELNSPTSFLSYSIFKQMNFLYVLTKIFSVFLSLLKFGQ